ncbi:Retrovirus-related Pol polyprotein from transposon 17.6 [Gossypium australe]|uniref:Retrovirus-related Pol polyprotein from transposon 17.6 n=1 Tax=Gossypium australe TaxID=47621 RepID=A0A5B6V9G6_9ROSI|nr:Retrovirus-related Pol polyprotein from transposon 17.6 [Gossypium australe]
MVKEGIIFGNKISRRGIEVDKAKVDVVEKLPSLAFLKGATSFLGHASFYRTFIKDISKVVKPLCTLLEKDIEFSFDEVCLKAFDEMKRGIIKAPIIVTPNWSSPFKLICDTSDFAVGALMATKVTVYMNHLAIKHFLAKKEAKPRLVRCVTTRFSVVLETVVLASQILRVSS